MNYAVVKIGGKQYKVSENQQILVDKLADPEKIKADVLLLAGENDIKVGKPILDNVKVTFEIINQLVKGEKVDVFKYKSKSRYRKHTGFRPQYTRLLVKKITIA